MKVCVLLIVTITLLPAFSANKDCECLDFARIELARLTVEKNVLMTICGNRLESGKGGVGHIVGVIAIDCEFRDTLLDYSYDETTVFEVKESDSAQVILREMTLVLTGANWDEALVPDTEYVFQIDAKKDLVVTASTVFCPPSLSLNQFEHLDSLGYVILSEINREARPLTSVSEHTIYKLFMGHLNGVEIATKTLLRLRSHGDLDGAYAETLAECGF